MKKSLLLIFIHSLIIALVFTSCKKGGGGAEPGENAQILEFNIVELPEVIFSINHDKGIIEVTNHEAVTSGTDHSALTASFAVSEGASVLVEETEQVSGETINNFSGGLFYTVVSEDGVTKATYFVHLERNLPLKYLLRDEPAVQINPSGRNPLSAKIDFETRGNSHVMIKVLGDIPIERAFSNAAREHSVPVLGLYAATENQVVLSVSDSDGITATDTLLIQTDVLPDFLPTPEINVLNEALMEMGMHFNEVHIGNAGVFNSHPIIFDNNGDIRWYIDLSEHSNIVWPIQFNADNTFFTTRGNNLLEYDMLGNKTNEIVVENNDLHHDIIKLPSRNYVVAVVRDGTTMIKNGEEIESVEDYIIEVNSNGTIVNEWDLAEVLDVNRVDLTDGGSDWFHMNAIWYSEEDTSLIVSGRNQGVVKINWDNELQWILAPHQGWGKAGRYEKTTETAPFLLTAVDGNGVPYNDDIQQGTAESDDFSWVWGQHAPLILPNGNLFIFDNGFNRNFGNASSNYSLGIEYEINQDDMTVKEVWSYGRERGAELFSNIISDVDYLSETGNRLFMPGIVSPATDPYSKIVEITYPEKEVVFEATLYFKNQLVAGSGWGNLDITYRAERVSLYR